MRDRCLGIAIAILTTGAVPASAETLRLECKNAKSAYKIVFDTQTRALTRQDQDGTATLSYRVMRTQFEEGDGLVWGMTSERGGDVLAFFGSKPMMKYFYGNGSETTDACVQK